jgi:glyoxylase-like metal-dependent hydrolase (beta-lactamase superfamily II)
LDKQAEHGPESGQGSLAIRYPVQERPAWGCLREIAPGVLWAQMPLPFALNHVNVWILNDNKGWTIVDTGLDTPVTRKLWRALIDQHLSDLPITRVVVTHFHPDHFGLSGWMTAAYNAELWMSAADYLSARSVHAQLPGFTNADSAQFFGQHGLDEERQEAVRHRAHAYETVVSPPPTAFRRLLDGAGITIGGCRWQVMTGYGHAPEHAALYSTDKQVLIAGDMILPTISSNISVWTSEPNSDPLDLFFRSLNTYSELPDSTLVLPSHGLPFYGLRERVSALRDHHADRLDRVLRACEEPRSAAEIIAVLFPRPLDTYQLVFAMGETIAHLNHLEFRGLLKRSADLTKVVTFLRLP